MAVLTTPLYALLLFLLCAPQVWSEKRPEGVGPFPEFKTEPFFESATINITTRHPDRSLFAPGYFFIGPYVPNGALGHGGGFGPQIFDHDGHLVYYGNDLTEHRTQLFQVVDYKGEKGTHFAITLSRYTGPGHVEKEVGIHRIYNNRYEQIERDMGQAGDLDWPNPHEFNMLPGGETYLQVVYNHRTHDLREYGGPEDGFYLDGCFQEVDLRTGAVPFRWCTSDHFELWHTEIFMAVPMVEKTDNFTSKIAGDGTHEAAWDYAHINAVDKNHEGDYIVSLRHFNVICKVAGNDNVHGVDPGKVMWQLGGRFNKFDLGELAKNQSSYFFSRQHDVRFVSTTKEETIFRQLNNAWDGINDNTAIHSAGQIIKVNNKTLTAEIIGDYANPKERLTPSQGSAQILPNKNFFVGWGHDPQFTEFLENGTVIYDADFAIREEQSYRAYKFPWVGKPTWDPKLIAFSKTCKSKLAAANSSKGKKKPEPASDEASPLVAYVSWNGATEVDRWKFYTSSTTRNGPWIPAGTFKKEGFETKAILTSPIGQLKFKPYVSVDALDRDGNVLGSVQADTFVPKKGIREKCDDQGDCEPGPDGHFHYRKADSCARTCGTGISHAVAILLLVIIGIESADYLSQSFWERSTRISIFYGTFGSEKSYRMTNGNGTTFYSRDDVDGKQSFESQPTAWGGLQVPGRESDVSLRPSIKRNRSGRETPGKEAVHYNLTASGRDMHDA